MRFWKYIKGTFNEKNDDNNLMKQQLDADEEHQNSSPFKSNDLKENKEDQTSQDKNQTESSAEQENKGAKEPEGEDSKNQTSNGTPEDVPQEEQSAKDLEQEHQNSSTKDEKQDKNQTESSVEQENKGPKEPDGEDSKNQTLNENPEDTPQEEQSANDLDQEHQDSSSKDKKQDKESNANNPENFGSDQEPSGGEPDDKKNLEGNSSQSSAKTNGSQSGSETTEEGSQSKTPSSSKSSMDDASSQPNENDSLNDQDSQPEDLKQDNQDNSSNASPNQNSSNGENANLDSNNSSKVSPSVPQSFSSPNDFQNSQTSSSSNNNDQKSSSNKDFNKEEQLEESTQADNPQEEPQSKGESDDSKYQDELNRQDKDKNDSDEQHKNEPSSESSNSQKGDSDQEENELDNEFEMPKEKISVSKHVNHSSSNDDTEENEKDYEKEKTESTTTEKTETEQKKELLKRFRDAIKQAQNNLSEKELEQANLPEPPPLSKNANQFLGRIEELPHFDQRNKGPGYSIDTESTTEVDEIIIKNLISKFLNQRFCNRKEDLNVRSNSLEKSQGFLKWEVKDVIIHLETEQLTKVLNDKYGYDYSQGKNEFVPLSFYFDLSGSMSNYTNMLATIAIELLKKDVKVLIGYNESVEVQIDSLNKGINIAELTYFLENLESENHKIKYRKIDRDFDSYLIDHKAEKVCVFSDFDPKRQVCNLSHHAKVYWFCFESNYKLANLTGYDGFIYPVKDLDTIADGLKKVNAQRFEALIYTENPKQLRKVIK